MSEANAGTNAKTDVVLVGAGIMSATLGTLIKLLEPNWSITMIERLDGAAAESSDPWNNAGTGHSALCELNYTPALPDGTIDISKAVNVNEQFQVSRQFWAHAVENGVLPDVRSFLNPVPHVSFVYGADNVQYLKARYNALVTNPLFASMEFIDDKDEFTRRLPLMAEKRDFSEPVALNWSQHGTDVDFGSLSRQLIGFAAGNGMTTMFGHDVRDLSKNSDGSWTVKVRNRRTGNNFKINAKFVFVGAGGGALPLLQKSGIPEAKGFGGFPVGGAFLRTNKQHLTSRHNAKVYGLPPLGAPPMSVPHLDTRVINGRQWLLFGPFAGWSPKFLKQGKVTDLPLSVKPNNLASMLGVGLTEVGLLKYLIGQLLLSEPARVETLREFAQRSRFRLGAGHRRAARAGDPAQGRRRRTGVRHHGARGGRRQHRRPARRVAGCLHRGARDARRVAAVLRRPLPGLDAQAEGDGAVAGHQAVRRAQTLRGGVVVGHQGAQAGRASEYSGSSQRPGDRVTAGDT